MPVLLVYGCVPTGKGQLLSYISWNSARFQHRPRNKAPLPARLHLGEPHCNFTGIPSVQRRMTTVSVVEFHCPALFRCFRCLLRRYRFCVEILRLELALFSVSPRIQAQTSCSLSKSRFPCLLESQVQCVHVGPSDLWHLPKVVPTHLSMPPHSLLLLSSLLVAA